MNDRVKYLEESIKKANDEIKVYEKHIRKLQEDRTKELVVTAELKTINSMNTEIFNLKNVLEEAISTICFLCCSFNPHFKTADCNSCEKINKYRKVVNKII